jgi:hypothetical protein
MLTKTMTLQIFREKARHTPKAFEFFNFNKLDAFHCQEVLSVIYGDSWESILIVDGNKAFLHTFSKQRIGETEWYDIEPFFGYSGMILNTDDSDFINAALNTYSKLCREENIIAEIIRFNPLLQNHKPFEKLSQIKISPAKEIVIINCLKDEEQLIQSFEKATRKNIRNYALENYKFETYGNPKKIEPYLEIYYPFMQHINASEEWHFSQDFFERVEKSPYFKIALVSDKDSVCSTGLTIEHPLASYCFYSVNKIPHSRGAHEFLLLKTSVDAANNGITKLILGGGNSSSPDDPLLRYKKKFVKETTTFYIGKLIHNNEVFDSLCNEAVSNKPEIAETNFFLKYRL